MARYCGWDKVLCFWEKTKYIMLRLSSNSMNVSNLSTERIPAIHVSGHDMTMEAGVEGMDRPQGKHVYEYNAYRSISG